MNYIFDLMICFKDDFRYFNFKYAIISLPFAFVTWYKVFFSAENRQVNPEIFPTVKRYAGGVLKAVFLQKRRKKILFDLRRDTWK